MAVWPFRFCVPGAGLDRLTIKARIDRDLLDSLGFARQQTAIFAQIQQRKKILHVEFIPQSIIDGNRDVLLSNHLTFRACLPVRRYQPPAILFPNPCCPHYQS